MAANIRSSIRPPRLIRPVKAPATVPPPLDGPWAPTDTRLDQVRLLPLPSGTGPEDVAVDLAGRLITGGDDGCLWRWPAHPDAGSAVGAASAVPADPAAYDGHAGATEHADPADAAAPGVAAPGAAPTLVARTGGRPLGIEIDPRDGSLVVCDAYRGLLRVTEDGTVVELTSAAAGTPIVVCNNAAIARDGTIFFTDSSSRFPLSAWRRDILEQRPNGRLLAYRPDTGQTEVVASKLYFPNGVALTPDESAVLVAETAAHRLLRVPLGGGDPIELADLPAYPDNMSPVGDGTYWIALPSPRVSILERLMPHPNLRRLADLMPQAVQPQPKRYAVVALVDGQGQVLRTLHGPRGTYPMLTGVRQHGATLFFGSLTAPAVAFLPLTR